MSVRSNRLDEPREDDKAVFGHFEPGFGRFWPVRSNRLDEPREDEGMPAERASGVHEPNITQLTLNEFR